MRVLSALTVLLKNAAFHGYPQFHLHESIITHYDFKVNIKNKKSIDFVYKECYYDFKEIKKGGIWLAIEKLECVKDMAKKLDTIYSKSPPDYFYIKGWIHCLLRQKNTMKIQNTKTNRKRSLRRPG